MILTTTHELEHQQNSASFEQMESTHKSGSKRTARVSTAVEAVYFEGEGTQVSSSFME